MSHSPRGTPSRKDTVEKTLVGKVSNYADIVESLIGEQLHQQHVMIHDKMVHRVSLLL